MCLTETVVKPRAKAAQSKVIHLNLFSASIIYE